MKSILRFLLIAAVISPWRINAQEYTAPLSRRSAAKAHTAARPTALSLPFFEDFTGYAVFPDPALWEDHSAYVSNTMPSASFSRGCATFDANNARNVPYDSMTAYHQVLADSLTTQAIDLSTYTPGDSLWLSFYYEPGGNGFPPKPEDSLMLYFLRNDGLWQQVWATGGDTANRFKNVMIPVKDTGWFHDQFRFRFINKATFGISNSEWNVDYILLDAHRNYADTLVRDIAFTANPSPLLGDFTAMPYVQFKTNPGTFLASNLSATLQHSGALPATVSYGYKAMELLTGTALGTAAGSSVLVPGANSLSFPLFNFSGFLPPASSGGKVVIQTQYYATGIYPNEPKDNDTIVQNQVFDNYFAYDDGSAEKSYFLHLYQSAPGAIAVEYALYAPDTLRGISIYFPRTVPTSEQKDFSLAVYRDIAVNGGTDDMVYREDFLNPVYQDTVNEFTTYTFSQPVPLPAGTFYISIIQSAGGYSDSLYIGLDVNRTGGNHRYFNIDGTWQPSLIDGALLLRPLVGKKLPPSGITPVPASGLSWTVTPNPANHQIQLSAPGEQDLLHYQINDMQGRQLQSGKITNRAYIDISSLRPGMYFIRMSARGHQWTTRKLIKQ